MDGEKHVGANALLVEFEQSGLDIDSFLRKKLQESGRNDAVEVVAEINEVSARIDDNYASLKQAKANGESRQSWLKRKLDPVFDKIAPRQAGAVMGHLINQLSRNGEEVPDDAVYTEINADEKIEALDQAIRASVCYDFLGNGREE